MSDAAYWKNRAEEAEQLLTSFGRDQAIKSILSIRNDHTGHGGAFLGREHAEAVMERVMRAVTR